MGVVSEFTNTAWKETLQVNALRSVCAGIGITVLGLVMMLQGKSDMPPWALLFLPFSGPVLFFAFVLPGTLIISSLSALGLPLGIGNLALSLFMIPGDPVMALLHKTKPGLVPVDTYRLLEFSPLIQVMKKQESTREQVQASSGSGKCPFAGEIVAAKNGSWLGFQWKKDAMVLTIHDDWLVETPQDSRFGWIDKKGYIHKGLVLGTTDPSKTMALDLTDICVNPHTKQCCRGNDVIGKYAVNF